MSDFYENFRKQALEKLDREYKAGKYGNKENAMKSAVRDALRNFCEQDGEFAQAVAQGGSFEDCMKKVANGVGSSISDLEAYRRAVQFYFPGADIAMTMTVNLCASVETSEEAATEKKDSVVLDLSDFLLGGRGDV